MSEPTRRKLLTGFAAAALACPTVASAQSSSVPIQAPAVARPPDLSHATVVDVSRYARPDTERPQTAELQAAIDAARAAGVPLVFGRGRWMTDAPLRIIHTERRRSAFPKIIGAGVGETIIQAIPFSGALFEVRGAPLEPPPGTFFLWGGGIEGMSLVGSPRGPADQHALNVLGWLHGKLEAVHVTGFRGSGLIVTGDRRLDPNPDWTVSNLTISGCWFERLGKWGFLDENPVGANAFSFENVVFVLCGEGGAWVRSQAHRFVGCSFSACGFIDERTPGLGRGSGLQVGDRARTTNRLLVSNCEFDTNLTAQIALDNVHSFTIERSRFVHHDRYGLGRLTPASSIVVAGAGPESVVTNGTFSELLVRIDRLGSVIGLNFANTENVWNLVLDGFHQHGLQPPLARLTPVFWNGQGALPSRILAIRR
jgi:hypothetical protein